MRKSSTNIICSTVISLIAAAPCFASGDDISAAPHVPNGDKLKTPVRAPKLIPVTPEQAQAEVKQLKTDLLLKPNDANLHYKLGEVYRKENRISAAINEYRKAIELDNALWVAYHQLTATTDDTAILDDAIAKLTKLEKEKPKELLLRVALSEAYEKRGEYYQAARTLVDLTYEGGVPEKFRAKVSARIHNMLVLSKSQHQQVQTSTPEPEMANIEEEMDVMPAPLPTPNTKRSIAQAKLKDSKEVRGMGHTNLLP